MNLRQFLLNFEMGDPDAVLWVDPYHPRERYDACSSDLSGKGFVAIGKLRDLRDVEGCERSAIELTLATRPKWTYKGVYYLRPLIEAYWDDPDLVLHPTLVDRIKRCATQRGYVRAVRENQVSSVLRQIEKLCFELVPQACSCFASRKLSRY